MPRPRLVRSALGRLLSLDVDGAGFPDVGVRDPVIGMLQRRYPGLRPVGFFSPYEAAAWAVLSHRITITRAAALKQRISERYGETVDVDGVLVTAFPSPDRLRRVGEVRGMTELKAVRLRGIADAALRGDLDGNGLRDCDPDEALTRLQQLPRDRAVQRGTRARQGRLHSRRLPRGGAATASCDDRALRTR
jgi:DNA-3-methyladenine glycosylase II